MRIAILALFLAQSVSDQLQQRTGQSIPKVVEQPDTFTLPPGVQLTDQVAPRDAVAIALWNNKALRADLANLDVSRSDLIEARQFRNPGFSALLPVGPKPFEFLLTWPIEELWQRGPRIRAARLNVDAVGTGLVQNGLNLIRDVRLAHSDLWLAGQRTRTLQESANLRARIATLTERRRDAGDATGLDVRLAALDGRSTQELAQRSLGEIEVVRSRLRLLMGLRDDRRPLVAVLDGSNQTAVPDLPELLETAMSSRPDLRAAELNVEVAAERGKWQRSRLLALLAPQLSTKGVGTAGIRTGPGLSMDVPAFNRNQGAISRADAEVMRAGDLYASVRDRVEQEVVESHERVLQAQASLANLQQQVRSKVDEAIRITERSYQNGDVSLLTVLEATRQRYDIALREIEAEAALYRARAELERAIGRSL